MKQQDLAVAVRESSGKGVARQLRLAGKVPAVFYGSETETISLEVATKSLMDILRVPGGKSNFFNLVFEGGKVGNKLAVIKDLQIDPVSDRLIHADFLELSMNKPMTAVVPVVLTGKAKGVELGGTLQPIRRELEVSCLPKDLPDVIEIDVTDLDVGQSIHIDDVKLPTGVEAPHDVNYTVAVLLAKKGAALAEEIAEDEAAEAKAEAKE
ncbi:MAG: 50S ribosomal protein L25 [bacterium]|nr:50S ribosomal protein L25 [bacterium]